jgi:transcription-repair coupling factor (superfamily II helicase)
VSSTAAPTFDPVDLLAKSGAVHRLSSLIERTRRVVVRGGAGSSTSLLTGALSRTSKRTVLLVTAHVDDADNAEDELRGFGVAAVRFPALEVLPGESSASVDLLAQRLGVVEQLKAWSSEGDSAADRGRVVIAPIQALMQSVPSQNRLSSAMMTLRKGESPGIKRVVDWLSTAGYTRTDAVQEPGDYALRGGILDIFPPGDPGAGDSNDPGLLSGGAPVRLDFFGAEIERITEIDPDTMGADRTLTGVRLVCASVNTVLEKQATDPGVSLAEMLPKGTAAVLSEVMEITEQARGYFERATDAHGIFGPPAVFQSLQKHCASVIEVTAIGQYAAGERDEVIELPVSQPPVLDDDAVKAVAQLTSLASTGSAGDDEVAMGPPLRVMVFCQNPAEQSRLHELLREGASGAADQKKGAKSRAVESVVAFLSGGFVLDESADRANVGGASGLPPTLLIPYGELLHRFTVRRRASGGRHSARLRAGRAMDTFLDLQIGDCVVHNEHGIALFTGLKFMKVRQAQRTLEERLRDPGHQPARRSARDSDITSEPDPNADDVAEFISLEFDGGAKLHVPCMNADQVQKYIGGFRGKPQLSTLGGQRWQNQKERVKESVKDLAAALLRVRAGREAMPGIKFPGDTPWQKAFEDEFPYEETEDQLAALQEIKKDMTSPRPMDRLLCGDVGYGKTEMAIRAAFKAVEHGKQVAVLVPTTVLAEQHERTFASRMKDYPFRVASLSRFKTDKEIRETLELVQTGDLDVVVGTHRLLSKDVRFADLGLVIIDEEQRFGVEHKEKLLALRMTVDVLTLSATPIPRTLHMSMLGLRDISSLATAPADRRAVVTEVAPYNEIRLKQIIARELARDGQVFFVHNRVHNIQSFASDVQRLAPSARIVIGHGQMPDGELEKVMLTFMRRQADILVCTTIIESGIDIPTANTIIINDADRFGLAELHQLRGRVGRGKHRGYCYLLLPKDRPVREPAKKRLKAIEEYSMLGAGFKIAMRDLEIRGAGNILGPEQSGHIHAVGYDMYCQLLDRAVKELRNEVTTTPSETSIEIGVVGCIPKPYIPSDIRRLEAYRRIALASNPDELQRVRADLTSAYGEIPPPCERLLQLAEVRIGARLLGVRTVTVKERDLIVRTIDQPAVVSRFHGAAGRVSALPTRAPSELPEVYFRPDNPQTLAPATLLAVLRKRMGFPQSNAHQPPAGRASPTIIKPSLNVHRGDERSLSPSRAEDPRKPTVPKTGVGAEKVLDEARDHGTPTTRATQKPGETEHRPGVAKAQPTPRSPGLLDAGGTGISPSKGQTGGSPGAGKPPGKSAKANLAKLRGMMKQLRNQNPGSP